MQDYLWIGIAVIDAVLAFAVWDWYRAFASATSDQPIKGVIPAASIPAQNEAARRSLLRTFESAYVPFLRLSTVCIAASLIFMAVATIAPWAIWVSATFALVAWVPYLWCSVLGNTILERDRQQSASDEPVDA